jgi:monoamine oxidase
MTAAPDKAVFDTVIVGGGLCGLALADSLQTLGRDWALYEARPRLGGRIRSQSSVATGAVVDLGPTWFWPHADPNMKGLISELGLANFQQHDDGTAVELKSVDERPVSLAAPDLHGGAGVCPRRASVGGAVALGSGAAYGRRLRRARRADFPSRRRPQHGVGAPCGARHLAAAGWISGWALRRSCPPSCAGPCAPRLPGWPSAAKAVVAYPSAYWRNAGLSGNAFVTHEQAVLAEIFDACGAPAALGGFLVLSPAQRESFQRGLPMLIHSQIAQVFGEACGPGDLHYQDWAAEEHTCCDLDRSDPAQGDYPYGQPPAYPGSVGRQALSGGFGDGCSGRRSSGGALAAAGRLRRALSAAAMTLETLTTSHNESSLPGL